MSKNKLVVIGGSDAGISAGLHAKERSPATGRTPHNGMTVEALNDLDLSHTPPLSGPWDPVQMAAQAWGDTLQGDSSASHDAV